MKYVVIFVLLLPLCKGGDSPAGLLWAELKAKREKLPAIHQEFDVNRTFRTTHGNQSAKSRVVVDVSEGRWRERAVSGSADRVKVFDGNDLYTMEEGGEEYVRVKRSQKEGDLAPAPYLPNDADWSKAVEVERRHCGYKQKDHDCVVLEVSLKPWNRPSIPTGIRRMTVGSARVLLDPENGVVLGLQTVEVIENRSSTYQATTTYSSLRVNFADPVDVKLFQLPADSHEVKELSRWDSAKIKKQLKGKIAPGFTVTDIHGKQVELSTFKGKTVLLDFWTTWCPPCRADAPSLDKLYKKYGEDLMIVGFSVSEDRDVVQGFLEKHPHDFPTVLTSENELPAAYQIGVFPTYIVIDRDGTLASAVQGNQGFSELRKLLKKAGLELE